jgi:hypothetical protein
VYTASLCECVSVCVREREWWVEYLVFAARVYFRVSECVCERESVYVLDTSVQ